MLLQRAGQRQLPSVILLRSGPYGRIAESALLLASLRRLLRPADLPPLSPIRSLAYFQPVVDELRVHPMPAHYLDYLRLKLNRIPAGAAPAQVQKTTFSDDR